MPNPEHTDVPGDEHYLKAVTQLGDAQPLVLSRPVFSANGIKLLDTGARINGHVFERLIEHKLAAPIEQCVSAADAVDHPALEADARRLVAAQPLLAKLVGALGDTQPLWAALAGCPLPPPLAFRLTVARGQRAALYEHSLRAAAVALWLALRSNLEAGRLPALATAALLHDIGMLHADPAHFIDGQPLNAAGRRLLWVHPITGRMIVERERGLDPAIAEGIAQHHERLDGGGYPAGLSGARIGAIGRILMVVEVTLAMIENDPARAESQLSLILRLNHHSFDRRVADALLAELDPNCGTDTPAPSAPLDRINALLADWERLQGVLAPAGAPAWPAVDHLALRIGRLRRQLYEAGLGPDLAVFADGTFATDPVTRAEHAALVREASWQLRQIAIETMRRWPEITQVACVSPLAPLAQWLADVDVATRPV